MALLSKEKEVIKNDYFRVWDIVELLYEKTDNNWDEVVQFLGHYNFFSDLVLFEQDSYYRIHEVYNNYEPIKNLTELLYSIAPWDTEEEIKGYLRKAKVAVINYLWLKQDIYKFTPIMKLGVIEKPRIDNSPPKNSSSLQKPPPPPFVISPTPTREESETQEIERLKVDLAKAQERIRQLEADSLTKKSEPNNLLDLIFDESATERYAPDLALSIRLWEHIYITNSNTDSHSNNANSWLKSNTGYDVAKKQGSASKIREITNPFLKWGTQRDKKYKK